MNPRIARAHAAPMMPLPANTRLTATEALLRDARRQRDAAIAAALRRFLSRLAAWRTHRRALAELRGLTDRELADIGLTRAGTPLLAPAVPAPVPDAPRAANDAAAVRAAA